MTLITHLLILPYQQSLFNTIDTFMLISLCLLSMVMATFPDPHLHSSPTSMGNTIGYIDNDSLSIIITILVGVPVLSFLIYALIIGIGKLRLYCVSPKTSFTIGVVDPEQQSIPPSSRGVLTPDGFPLHDYSPLNE
jgi:hypothetical protein